MVRAGLVVLESLALTWTQRLFLAFCSLTDLHCFIFLIPEVLRARTKAAACRPSICLRMYVRRTFCRRSFFPNFPLDFLFPLIWHSFKWTVPFGLSAFYVVRWGEMRGEGINAPILLRCGPRRAARPRFFFASPVLIWNSWRRPIYRSHQSRASEIYN